jgi:hypothetical protein
MATPITYLPLTPLESFSIANEFTEKMSQWNQSTDYPKLGYLAARVVGCAWVAFAALVDAFIHIVLIVAKIPAMLAVLSFRACFVITRELNLSSPLTHLVRTIQSIVNIFLLPFLCACDPDQAYGTTKFRTIKEDDVKQVNNLREQLKQAQDEWTRRQKLHEINEEELKNLNEAIPLVQEDIELKQPSLLTSNNLAQENKLKLQIVKKEVEQRKLQQEKEIEEMRILLETMKEDISQFTSQLEEYNKFLNTDFSTKKKNLNDKIDKSKTKLQELETQKLTAEKKLEEALKEKNLADEAYKKEENYHEFLTNKLPAKEEEKKTLLLQNEALKAKSSGKEPAKVLEEKPLEPTSEVEKYEIPPPPPSNPLVENFLETTPEVVQTSKGENTIPASLPLHENMNSSMIEGFFDESQNNQNENKLETPSLESVGKLIKSIDDTTKKMAELTQKNKEQLDKITEKKLVVSEEFKSKVDNFLKIGNIPTLQRMKTHIDNVYGFIEVWEGNPQMDIDKVDMTASMLATIGEGVFQKFCFSAKEDRARGLAEFSVYLKTLTDQFTPYLKKIQAELKKSREEVEKVSDSLKKEEEPKVTTIPKQEALEALKFKNSKNVKEFDDDKPKDVDALSDIRDITKSFKIKAFLKNKGFSDLKVFLNAIENERNLIEKGSENYIPTKNFETLKEVIRQFNLGKYQTV